MTPQLLWHASAYTADGYADETRSFLRALEGAGASPGLSNFHCQPNMAGLSDGERQRLEQQEQRAQIMDLSKATVCVQHFVPLPGMDVPTRDLPVMKVARCMFETDQIPHGWLRRLSNMDEIWVPSQFNVDTFSGSGVPRDKLRVVGGSLDFDLYDPARPDLVPLQVDGLPEGKFVFLSNFDFQERKGWRQLLAAWAQAFTADDPVVLLLKTRTIVDNGDMIDRQIEAFLDARFGAGSRDRVGRIVLLKDLLTEEDMVRLYAAADAYVMPTRGEGWGRPYMEALAMGLPTVGSNWSALSEFMSPDYSWLIDGKIVPVRLGEMPASFDGHSWFEADESQLADVMKQIASDPAAARRHASGARAALLDRFAPQKVAERLMYLADDLTERIGDRVSRPVSLAVTGTLPGAGPVPYVQTSLLVDELRRGGDERVRWCAQDEPDLSGQPVSLLLAPDAPAKGHGFRVELGNEHWTDSTVRAVRDRADVIVCSSEAVVQRLVRRGLPAARMLIAQLPGEAGRVVERIGALRRSGRLPVAAVSSASLDAHPHVVSLFPQFDGDNWLSAAASWYASVPVQAPVTLAIFCDGEMSAAAIERLSGHLTDCGLDVENGPDITVVEPGDIERAALAKRSCAVLAPEGDDVSDVEYYAGVSVTPAASAIKNFVASL